MRITECPQCGGYLGDQWTSEHKLQQYCQDDDCEWKGVPRIPEQLVIETTQSVQVGHFWGWHFEAFDTYGHLVISSKYYNSKDECMQDITPALNRSREYSYGPYTFVLWPPTVQVRGEIIK